MGTSGWAYPTWRPGFYPEKLGPSRFLGFYASRLNSVEVNHTFRALPTPAMATDWLRQTSPSFRFSFKAPQRITHFSRLVDCESHLAAFFAALAPFRDRLGMILFQLPPNFKADLGRLSAFLATPSLTAEGSPKIAFEFRHESWFAEEVYAILRAQNAALCIADTDDLTTPEVHTAGTHVCFRLRRAGGYSAAEIAAFARSFRRLSKDREVYAYFRHEDEPTGALNASACMERLMKKRRG